MSSRLQQYLAKPTVSAEDRSIEDNVPVSPIVPAIYTPLSQERVAELLSARPAPDKVLDFDCINRRIKDVLFTGIEGLPVTFCVIVLDNDFRTYGWSDSLAAENYSEELGKHFAYLRAYEDLIPICAHQMRYEEHVKRLEVTAPVETPVVEEVPVDAGERSASEFI